MAPIERRFAGMRSRSRHTKANRSESGIVTATTSPERTS